MKQLLFVLIVSLSACAPKPEVIEQESAVTEQGRSEFCRLHPTNAVYCPNPYGGVH